jgi:hypothetical protein
VLNARILALSVFTDQNRVDIVIRSLVSGNRFARSDVGEEVERSAEGQIEGDMAFTDGGL